MKTLYWRPEGQKITYQDGMLMISDLNPEAHMHWMVTRGELFWLAIRFFFASLAPNGWRP